jgi:hypothetical protein
MALFTLFRVLIALVKPYFAGLLVAAFVITGCRSSPEAIRPVIHTNEDRIAAMRSAPIILVAEIRAARLLPVETRAVEKPPGIGGPIAPRVLLDLAEVSAKVRLTMRGAEMEEITFYIWVYHFGKHGGPRLFHPQPGSFHVMFLRKESGFLHTVGDYPNYDLEIPAESFPILLSSSQTGYAQDGDLTRRIAAVSLKAYLESPSVTEFNTHSLIGDLTNLMGRPFVTGQLDSLCPRFDGKSPGGRVCANWAEVFRQ